MATNKFKPFATSPDANVMTDEQLASAEELSTGFKLKSKADSKLIGKLIQDTGAAAYAIGEFVVNNGGANDVTGTNATQLAQDFDKAVKSVVTGSSGDFVTNQQLTEKLEPITTSLGQKADASALESKADKTELTSLAPLANPQFTGNVTINGTNVATVDDLAEIEVDLSNYTGNVSLTQGDNAIKMTSIGVSIKSAGFNGGAETTFDKVALKSEIPTDVLTKAEAGSTYLTQQNASSTYATKSQLSTKADSANVYSKQDADLQFATKSEIPTDVLTKTEASGTYLSKSVASSTYATKGEIPDDYLPTTGGTIEGDLTVTGTINATIEGTTENATKLATARNITLTGAVTGASTTGFDGSADVTINVTSIAGANITGVVGEATKATQDGNGNVISTTYAKVSQLTSVMTYKGTVASESALPKSDQSIGDVYNVTDTNMNYAWDGSKWDQLGSTVDLSGYLKTETANSTFATKSEVAGKANATHTHTVSQVTDLSTTLAKYLPLSGGTLTGKVTGTITHADAATKATNDGSGKNIASTYATKTELSDGLATKAASTHTHTTAQVDGLDTALAGKAATNHTHTIANVTDLQTTLDGKAAASHTHEIANVNGLQDALDGKQATGDYALNSALSAYAPLASPVFTGTPKIGSNNVATTNQIPSITHLAPLASPALTGTPTVNGVGIADDNDVAAKINLTGSRGQLAGYEAVSSVAAVTINGDSADSIEASGNVTVSDGSAGQCWTKVVHITAGTPNVQLGGAWHWQNGSNPEMKTGGFLVLCWCSTAGLAIYNNAG